MKLAPLLCVPLALASCAALAPRITAAERILARAAYARGLPLADDCQHERAARHFERALEFDPDFTLAHQSLALSLLRVGRVDRARAAWERAGQSAPLPESAPDDGCAPAETLGEA